MRLGVIPEGFIDRLALLSGQLPAPLIEAFWGVAQGRTLLTALRLGVFDALDGTAKTAPDLAQELRCDPRATVTLLNALNGFGYLARRGGRYSLSKQSKKWIARGSPTSMRDALLFVGGILDLLGGMETAVREGTTGSFHDLNKPAEFWAQYERGLASFAGYAAPEVARKVAFSSPPKRLLDVGGGHGVYSAALCRKHHGLLADIIDLPPAAAQGRQIVAELGLSDRISFMEGDARTAGWGDGYDGVLLFNIIHNVNREDAAILMVKAFEALAPGGTLAILDSEHPGEEGDLSATAGINELMFFIINGCGVHPEADIRDWMLKAGFVTPEKFKMLTMPMTLLLTGKKPI